VSSASHFLKVLEAAGLILRVTVPGADLLVEAEQLLVVASASAAAVVR